VTADAWIDLLPGLGVLENKSLANQLTIRPENWTTARAAATCRIIRNSTRKKPELRAGDPDAKDENGLRPMKYEGR